MLSLIRKEIITQELSVGGAREIVACSNYFGELIKLREALKAKK